MKSWKTTLAGCIFGVLPVLYEAYNHLAAGVPVNWTVVWFGAGLAALSVLAKDFNAVGYGPVQPAPQQLTAQPLAARAAAEPAQSMPWWQGVIIGSAAIAIQTLSVVIKNPNSRARYYNIAVSVWQSAKQLQQAMLMDNPNDPNFQ